MFYYIMNKDTVIAKLHLVNSNMVFRVVNVYENFRYCSSNELINAWILGRQSSSGRAFMQELFALSDVKSDLDYINKTKCVSLNDTFWIKSESCNLTWKSVSPYQNKFNSIVSNLAFGMKPVNSVLNTISPEYSTGGQYAKCWKRLNNGIYLFKRGHDKWNESTGNEPFSEYFTCQVASALGINNYVKYDLGSSKKGVVSICKLFTSEDVGFLPAFNLGIPTDIDSVGKFMQSIGSEMLYRSMLLLDSLVYNVDRHDGNYGVLVNNDTGKVLAMSPIFDNNLALLPTLPYTGESRESILDFIRGHRCPATMAGSFLNQAKRIMTPELYKSLLPLQKFKFKQHPRVKFDQARLDFLGSFVRYNARSILKACKDLA